MQISHYIILDRLINCYRSSHHRFRVLCNSNISFHVNSEIIANTIYRTNLHKMTTLLIFTEKKLKEKEYKRAFKVPPLCNALCSVLLIPFYSSRIVLRSSYLSNNSTLLKFSLDFPRVFIKNLTICDRHHYFTNLKITCFLTILSCGHLAQIQNSHVSF